LHLAYGRGFQRIEFFSVQITQLLCLILEYDCGFYAVIEDNPNVTIHKRKIRLLLLRVKRTFPPVVVKMLESALGWYQGRISLYDKQSWETTVEQRILQGLSYTPRKTTKFKSELIDVDLVRGSTFPKAKPESGLWLAGLKGIVRLIFLPLYGGWWIRETSCTGFLSIFFLYVSIILSGAIMIMCRRDENIFKNVPASEVSLPGVALLILSIIHSQIVCTRHSGVHTSPNHKGRPLGVHQSRRIRAIRRSTSLSGRGKCMFCSNLQPPDISRQLNNTSKKRLTVLKNRSFKRFRSHSEEPRQDEAYPLQPRSSSENNVSPDITTKEQPDIVIIKTNNEEILKTTEKLSSSVLTSSSDKSPVSTEVNAFMDHIDLAKIKRNDIRPNGTNKKFSEAYERVFIKSTTGGDSKKGNYICQEAIDLLDPLNSNKGSKSSNDGGSDGGEESGMGEMEGIDSLRDNWNLRKSNRCPRCLHFFNQLNSDGEATHSSRDNLPSSTVERSSCNSSCESDAEQSPSSQYSKSKLSEYEWTGITTNSDDLSYSSESEGGWDDNESLEKSLSHTEALDWNIQGSPAAIITSPPNVSDKVSCKIFEGLELKKVDLSVLDISSTIISKVDSLQHDTYYLQFGLVMAILIALVPSMYRMDYSTLGESLEGIVTSGAENWLGHFTEMLKNLLAGLFGDSIWSTSVIILCCVSRFCIAGGFFFLLSVAERTFKQRFLYAKHFCYLTSARRARKYDLPHFRLNKVHNIKTWLSVRSCLKKRGPQRSVDVIVSATFFLTLLLVCYLCFELLKEEEKSQHTLYNIELFFWCFPIGIYLIRFMTLGAMINKKYSSLSVLITEQINMYLHMEQKPQKKDELMLANNVLKLVSVLLKELESPFKISGLSANPLLYNVTRLVVLSACSGVLSDLLGFKLKLQKIKFEE
ncbi:Male germ-cell putative homeodomain transcription factor, partial [Halocaridina rubra]